MPDDLAFRPVRIEDKPCVLDFTRNTWGEDDGDYIQYVFDDWLADPRGEFTAAMLDGEVVAIAKLTDMGDDEWWFEGLRVDPAHRLKGIAAAFNRYHVELAKRLGGKVVRYMTGGENIGSQAVGAKAGFQHILTFAAHLADATNEFALPALLTLDDAPELSRWINSTLMRYQHGVYHAGWKAKTMTESEMRSLIEAQQAYGQKDGAGRVNAWAVLRSAEYDEDSEDNEDRRLRVDHLDGEMTAVADLARSMRSLAAVQNRPVVSMGICDYPPLVRAVGEAGYQPNPDQFSLWVLELKLTSPTGTGLWAVRDNE